MAGIAAEPAPPRKSGRAAQRRRTRKAIVQATAELLTAGADPSINDIADAADVSRRTIYTYFPTLDQLLLDASIEAIGLDVGDVLDAVADADVHVRVERMIAALADGMSRSLPIGRKLIRLTVDAPPGGPGPKRGYRRIGWIERAVEPLRGRLGPGHFDDLVSGLSLVVGWEAFIVLFDIRALNEDQARKIVTNAALALIDAAVAQAPPDEHRARKPQRARSRPAQAGTIG